MTATAAPAAFRVRALRYPGPRALAPCWTESIADVATYEDAVTAAIETIVALRVKHGLTGEATRYVDPIAQMKGYTPSDYVAVDLPGGWVVGIEAI